MSEGLNIYLIMRIGMANSVDPRTGVLRHLIMCPYWAAFSLEKRSRLLPNWSKLSVHLRQFSVDESEYPQTILKLSFGTTKMAVPMQMKFLYAF